jgi:hypothetical protein
MNGALYNYPDGMGAIHYDAQALWVTNDNDSATANASIGPVSLHELAAKLLALADTLED